MKILIACEFSGTVRDAFRELGHDAWSCDIIPTERKGPHILNDARNILDDGWDMMIAHPPCTYMTNSGVAWLHKDKARWAKLDQAAAFFSVLLNALIPRIAIENPIMHKYAKQRIDDIKQTQVIHPWMFGHTEQKATCLWLKGLPMLTATKNVKEEMLKLPAKERQRLYYLPSSADRWKIRSKTYEGIANAMAQQWGKCE
jgi:hypothetical protein